MDSKPIWILRAWYAYELGLGKVAAGASAASRSLGMWSYRRPWTMLLVTFIVTAGICVGWVRFHEETAADVLCEYR